jgi:hypothetical protein
VRQLGVFRAAAAKLDWDAVPKLSDDPLNGAVQRFGKGVSPLRLKGVTVTDEDYREIDAGMTKSSKFEHDAAATVGRLPIPDPDELCDDIERLAKWREKLSKRVEGIAKGTISRSARPTGCNATPCTLRGNRGKNVQSEQPKPLETRMGIGFTGFLGPTAQ